MQAGQEEPCTHRAWSSTWPSRSKLASRLPLRAPLSPIAPASGSRGTRAHKSSHLVQVRRTRVCTNPRTWFSVRFTTSGASRPSTVGHSIQNQRGGAAAKAAATAAATEGAMTARSCCTTGCCAAVPATCKACGRSPATVLGL